MQSDSNGSRWLGGWRLLCVLFAVALMFTSAYSTSRFFAAGASIGTLTGLPEYARRIPEIRAEATWWKWLTVIPLLLAAFLLRFGKENQENQEVDGRQSPVEPVGRIVVTYSDESRGRLVSLVSYLLRLGISTLGALGFMVLLFLIGFVLYQLGIQAG